VKIEGEIVIGAQNLVFTRVFSYFLGVHATARNLDGTTVVEVVVAKVVCGCFNLFFGEVSGIVNYFVVNRLGSSDCSFVRNHEKVKNLIILFFNKCCI